MVQKVVKRISFSFIGNYECLNGDIWWVNSRSKPNQDHISLVTMGLSKFMVVRNMFLFMNIKMLEIVDDIIIR